MYLFEAPFRIGEIEKEILVVFSGQLEGGDLEYSQLIYSGFEKFTKTPEEVLFVYPGYIDDHIEHLFKAGSRCYRNLVRYGENVVPVTRLSFDIRGNFIATPVSGKSSICENLNELRDQIIDKGVFNLARLRKDQVILKAPSGTVFIKPSKQEYDEFIKASELAVGYAETQFVGFSLLSKSPNHRDIKKIYIDTSSISPFIEALLYYWVKFSNSYCKPAVYRSYSSYDGKDKAKPEDCDDVWLVISASRTNSMGKDMAADWGLDNDQVITLLSFTETLEDNIGDETLVNISALSESATMENDNGSLMKVKVVGENFTAEVEKPNPVLIRAEHKTPAVNSLITPHRADGLIDLNRRVDANHPISSVYFNCNDCFKFNENFHTWLNQVVDWYVPPKVGWLVYRGVDAESTTLADLIEKRLNENGITEYRKVDIAEAYKAISGDDCVVVSLPVTGSGQTLLKLNRNLRISGHKGNRIFISPFVVAPSKAGFTQFHNSLIYGPDGFKYQFFSWKSVYIGHCEDRNSWELERHVVEHLDSPFWKARAELLRKPSGGLMGSIGTPSLVESEPLGFSKHFAFWKGVEYDPKTVRHEAVYLTIASILQGLREKPYSNTDKDSLFSYVYQHSVIAPDNFTRFNDSLLHSCLWRAANFRELDFRSSPQLSLEFSGILERLIEENSSGSPNSAMDLLMGIATGKIQISPDCLRTLLEKAHGIYEKANENAVLLINYIRNKNFPKDYPHEGEVAV